jgi:hypothetical protein
MTLSMHLTLAVPMQLKDGSVNRRDAKSAARQSRNRTTRSVWSASSLLALSHGPGQSESGSKLHALHTLRDISDRRICSQLANNLDYCSAETDPSRSPAKLSPKGGRFECPLPHFLLCAHRVSAVDLRVLRLKGHESEYHEAFGVCCIPARNSHASAAKLGRYSDDARSSVRSDMSVATRATSPGKFRQDRHVESKADSCRSYGAGSSVRGTALTIDIPLLTELGGATL